MEMVIENINTITTLQDFNDYRNLLFEFEPFLNDIELDYFDQLIVTSLQQSSNQPFWKDVNEVTIKNEKTGEVDVDSLEHLLNDYRKDNKLDTFEKKKKEGKDLQYFTIPEFLVETTNKQHWIDKVKNDPSLRSFGNLTSGTVFGFSDSFDAKSYFDPEINKNIKDKQVLQGYLKDAYEGILAEQLLALDNPVATGYVEWSKNVRKAIDSQSWWITGVSNTLIEIAKTHDSFFGPNNAYSALLNVTNQAWNGTINLTKDILDVTNTSTILIGRSRPLRKAVVTSMTAPGYTRADIIKVLERTENGKNFAKVINLYKFTKVKNDFKSADQVIPQELRDIVVSPDFQSQFFIAFFTAQNSFDEPEEQIRFNGSLETPSNPMSYVLYDYYFYTNKFKIKPAKRKQETLQYGAFKVKKATNIVEGSNEFSFEVAEDIRLSLRTFITCWGLGVNPVSDYYANDKNTFRASKPYFNLHILLPKLMKLEFSSTDEFHLHHFILQDIQFTKISSLKFDHSNTNNSTATISGICRKILLCSENLETLYKRYK